VNLLEELAVKYGADKVGKHNYCPIYFEMLNNRRNDIGRVIEIGVGEGAGIRMWRDFLPNSYIVGMDNQDNRIFEDERMRVYKGDQARYMDLLSFIIDSQIETADLVIDDGSHRTSDQVFTALTLLPYMKKDSIYVIEDVSEPGILKYFSEYDCEVKHLSKRYDDTLIILRKKNVQS
jgi:hypothetical protein